jgi:hypothetical protein
VAERKHQFLQFEEISNKQIKIKLSNNIEPHDISFSEEKNHDLQN